MKKRGFLISIVCQGQPFHYFGEDFHDTVKKFVELYDEYSPYHTMNFNMKEVFDYDPYTDKYLRKDWYK